MAPIALYPDTLVAQILAASTYPTEIVEADRWVQQHSELKGEQLAQAVDQQSWDPSVKAITQFPSVLANMDKNLSWASALGDAYVNQQQAVLDAVQTMRRRAQQAGNLKTTAQENVVTQGQTIVIQPADPEMVYVPAYDPWLVYGPPLVAWTPALGAAVYEVQWSKTRYPFKPEPNPQNQNALGTMTLGTSVVLPLSAGTWYYRMRGFNYTLPTGAQQMSWSDPARIVVAKPKFKVVGGGR